MNLQLNTSKEEQKAQVIKIVWQLLITEAVAIAAIAADHHHHGGIVLFKQLKKK